MARTKQTARRSTGGKAPRKTNQATHFFKNVAPKLRQQGRTQQQVEEMAPVEVKFDVSPETSFFAHFFETGSEENKDFAPRYAVASACDPISGKEENWLSVYFNSKYDGEGIKTHKRPILNLVVCLDISGSMSCNFEGEENKSKIQVAKDCLLSLIERLNPNDSFGLVLFNESTSVVQELQRWSKINKTKLKQKIRCLRANGGTCICPAMEAATELYKDFEEVPNSSNRVFCLTDMEVDRSDGDKFSKVVAKNAENAMWSTITGIGLDLTSNVIEEVSKTPGCNYSNVRNTKNFQEIVTKEFDFMVTPIAFSINVALEGDFEIAKGYGSYEFRKLKKGDDITFSSHFPSAKNSKGETRSGVFLFKLAQKKRSRGRNFQITTSWQNKNGIPFDEEQTLTIPEPEHFDDMGIRKAILLTNYSVFLREYIEVRGGTGNTVKRFTALRKAFPKMFKYFCESAKAIGDKSLHIEISHLKTQSTGDDIPIESDLLNFDLVKEITQAGDNMDIDTEPKSTKRKANDNASPRPAKKQKTSIKLENIVGFEELDNIPYRTLQEHAKNNGIRANLKAKKLRDMLKAKWSLDGLKAIPDLE